MQKPAFVCTHFLPVPELFMAQDFTRVFNHLHFHLGLILWCRTNYSMHGPDQRGRGRKTRREVRENALPVSADAKSYKNVQNLEQFICSAPQDISAVCLLARAKVIHNSSSPEDDARGLQSSER